MTATEARERTVEANGLVFKVLEMGGGDRFALLLHGFPDTADSMLPLMERLAERGFATAAPYMRGYGDTDRAPDGDYRVSTLAQDAIALAEELSEHEERVLVGHDWGGIASYAVSTMAPDVFSSIVPISIPPTFWENMTPVQLFRSWYIAFFQIPGLSERALVDQDFALIERIWRDWSPGWDYPAERMEAVKATFATDGTPHAALTYYRDMVRSASRRYDPDGGFGSYELDQPMLVIAGIEDGCIGIELFADAERTLANPASRVVRVEDAGHFVNLEKPDRVVAEILDFIED